MFFLVLKPHALLMFCSYLVFSIYLAKKKQIYTMYISVNHFMYFCQRYNEAL